MQRVEAYRVEIPIVTIDEYSKEFDKVNKRIDDLEKSVKNNTKAQDDFSKSSKNAAKSQSEMSKATKESAKGVEGVGKSMNQTEKQVGRATKAFQSFGSKVKSLQRAKATVELAVKDNATRVMDRVRGSWESFRRNPITRLTVTAVDRAMRILRGVKNTVLSIPTMITIGLSYVGVKNIAQATAGAAMTFEQYEVSLEHWLGGNAKLAKELTKWMGDFADSTPFSSPDLFPALVEAVSFTNSDIGNTKRMMKIAADMAALTPGRSVEEAMNALSKAGMGDFDLLRGFRTKILKEDFKKIFGGSVDKVFDHLEEKFEDGAKKLSQTAYGKLMTLTGYRGSLFRQAGEGMLTAMKPRLDKIDEWIQNNQDTWGRWKDTVKGYGNEVAEYAFSNLEKGFSHIKSNYLENPEFSSLSLKGKITFISADLGGYLNETVKPKLTEWWDETGSGVALEIGKSIGSGIVEGIKLGLQAGGELLTSSYSDLATNFKETGFSKETGKSAAVVAATTFGAGYLAKKFVYNPAKSVYDTQKKARNWWTGGREGRQTRRDTRQTKWNESNDRRIERGLARGEKAQAARLAREAKTTRIPKGSSKLLKRVPLLGAGITAMSLLGATNEELPSIFGGLAGGWGGMKGGAALGSLLGPWGALAGGAVGGVAGAFGGEKLFSYIAGLFGPKKASASELPNEIPMNYGMEYEEYPGMRWKPGTSEHPMSAAWVPDFSSWHDNGEMQGKGVGMPDFTSVNEHVQMLSTTLATMSDKASVASHNIEALTMTIGEASSHVVGAFHPLSERTSLLIHNIEALTMNLGESSARVVGTFNPLTESGAVMNHNVTVLNQYLGESSGHVVGAFSPLNNTGPVLNQNVSALSLTLGMASSWVANLYGVQTGATAVKNALNNLTSRINSVTMPSFSTTPSSNIQRGVRPTPYARGGIATSPHLGLVAEAGVPEAMIPWDGSSRSKALWQQTGEALGMFDGNSSASGNNGGGTVAVSGGANGNSGGLVLNMGDINIGQVGDWSADSIFNMIAPVFYEKIVAALAKR